MSFRSRSRRPGGRPSTSSARRLYSRSGGARNVSRSSHCMCRSLVPNDTSSTNQVEEYSDPCVYGPNLYKKVFGPTADESILVGLQTFLRLCEEYPPIEEEEIEEEEKPSTCDTHSEESQTEQHECRQTICQTGDTNFMEACGSQTDYITSNACAQTHGPSVKTVCSQVEAHTKECQNAVVPPAPCTHCMKVSRSAQYSKKSKSKCSGKSSKYSSGTCRHCTDSEETPATTSCYCSSCKSKLKRKCSHKSSGYKICTTTSSHRYISSASDTKHQKANTCRTCCCTTSYSGFEDTETELNTSQIEDEVTIRYAIAKITKFFSYTTFEIMKSTSKKPRIMPKSLEGVFVLRNCEDKN